MPSSRVLPPRLQRLLAAASIAALASIASAAAASGPAPTVDLRDRSGRSLSLEAFRGGILVLDFWAPWCGPCRRSFPFLDALQTKYAADGLHVVGLTLEDDDDAIAAFLEAVPVRFTIARDTSERAGEAFGVVAMPTTFLLDREGRVAARFEGGDERTHRKIESAVVSLLEGRTLPPRTDVRVSTSVAANGSLKAWQRGYLADPLMRLDGDPLSRLEREHIHASKEGAAGDGGASGGGCGCN